MFKQRGFSLLELLLVVAVILTLSAIAVPRLLKARAYANTAAAAASVRAIVAAQEMYRVLYPARGYAGSLRELGEQDLLDRQLGCSAQACERQGYRFTIDQVSPALPISEYRVLAVPIQPGLSGDGAVCSPDHANVAIESAGGAMCNQQPPIPPGELSPPSPGQTPE